MATFALTGISPYDASNLTTPGMAGAYPNIGDEYRLDPDWSASTHALTFTITDDDSELSGDPAESVNEDSSQQTAVVTDATGNTIASGFIYTEMAFVVEGPGAQIITVQAVEIGDQLVGYVADGPIQPGANYVVTNNYQPNGNLAPSYSEFDSQAYEQADANVISGTDRADIFKGGANADSIVAGGGEDTLEGGADNDTLDGGGGNDRLAGGSGNDSMTGGAGNDVFVISSGSGADTISDFDITDSDGDGRYNDQLDLSGLTDEHGNPIQIADVVVSDDGFGNALLSFPNGETLLLQGVSPAQMSTSAQKSSAGVPCYAPGTLIDTPDGPRLVESLRPGDLVMTVDHGPQVIRWTRSGDHPLEKADVDDKPVQIKAGALGHNLPAQDLIVSPQHRILVGGAGQLDGVFTSEAFAPAKSLTGVPGIRHMKGKKEIFWVHFVCDRHEVVTANGCLSESLLLGPMAVKGLTAAEREAVAKIFGPCPTPETALNSRPARDCLKVGDVRRQIARHLKEEGRLLAKEIRKWDRDIAMEKHEAERLREVS